MKQSNSISSVKRSTDGVIFNIGDKIFDNIVPNGAPIIKFDKEGDSVLILTDYGACYIEQAVKI